MANQIGYEIDFLPVGNGEKNGDAIAIRYGFPGAYKIMVYDGGTKESGQALVDHIKEHYGTSHVDYVVNSHPDADHASGLSMVLEQLTVGELWMHQPWKYSSIILDYFHDGRITDNSLAQRLQDKMAAAYALERIAEERNIPVFEPFQGMTIGDFVVLSPHKDWYIHDLIADFTKSPEKKKEAAKEGFADLVYKTFAEARDAALSWIDEHWHIETLKEGGETSAENESSVVLFGQIDNHGILFTGDAGVKALTTTADYTESRNFSIPDNLHFVQVPHHGGRHNVSPSVLDRILGICKHSSEDAKKIAFVSASSKSTTHPRKVVTNAFIRRGVKVYRSSGQVIRYPYNMPERANYTSLTPLPFCDKVEA